MASLLCITGMHRSGTSLTTSWLESCGLTIHDGELSGPSIGNPKGNFEDKDFIDLHSSAMKLVKSRSDGWKIFTDNFLTFGGDHLSRAHKLVNERNAKYRTWGWKDPRSVIFLKHWKAIIPELKVLIVWRPCSEVADSLIRRSRKADQDLLKVTLFESVELWVRYNEKVCEYKQQYPDDTLLLPLDYIVRHDRKALNLLREKFQTNLKYRPIIDLYDPDLLHKGPVSLLVQLVSLYYGSFKVEKRLQNLSDTQLR